MRRFGHLAAGLLLMISLAGCCYRPGHYDPVTGMAWGGYWEPCCPGLWHPRFWGCGCGPGWGPGLADPYYGPTPTYNATPTYLEPQPVVPQGGRIAPQEGYYVEPGPGNQWVPAEPMDETPAPPADGSDSDGLPPAESSYYTPTIVPGPGPSAAPQNRPIITPAYGPGEARAQKSGHGDARRGQTRWVPAGY